MPEAASQAEKLAALDQAEEVSIKVVCKIKSAGLLNAASCLQRAIQNVELAAEAVAELAKTGQCEQAQVARLAEQFEQNTRVRLWLDQICCRASVQTQTASVAYAGNRQAAAATGQGSAGASALCCKLVPGESSGRAGHQQAARAAGPCMAPVPASLPAPAQPI